MGEWGLCKVYSKHDIRLLIKDQWEKLTSRYIHSFVDGGINASRTRTISGSYDGRICPVMESYIAVFPLTCFWLMRLECSIYNYPPLEP